MAVPFQMKNRYTMADLLAIMACLRAPGGCPWDREQTHQSIRTDFLEETYEAIEAINNGDDAALLEELGDVLLHIVFYAKIGDEKGRFDIADVCDALCEKLIFRHPHVFGDEKADTAAQVLKNWELIKMSEKDGNKMVLSGVPRSLPSLIKAERVQEKAANVGFDWQQREDVWDKVKEELGEVEAELRGNDAADREKEFGDLFFSLVNAARLYNVRPDNALERTNRKFIARFNYIEQKANEQGRHVNELTLAEMDELWNEAKAQHLGE
jgi:XTP/dITP diphosphohydrolase